MNKEEFNELSKIYLPEEIIRKYIKGEINLNESQLKKVIKDEKKRNKRENK